jgi:hypothetical protein
MSTRTLLACGIAAGPLYVIVGLAQVLTREGFDVRRHPLSLLSNGELGWIQISSFLLSGALVILGAIGVRRALRSERAGIWGPILLALYGAGLIGAGLCKADPALGFPPGTPLVTTGMSTSGLLHFVFGGIGFYSLIAACFVFARRFASEGRRGWVTYSVFTGAMFFITFAAIASGSASAVVMLGFYAAIVWVWIWHAALARMLLARASGA